MATAIEKINLLLSMTMGGVLPADTEVLPSPSDMGDIVRFIANGGAIEDYVEKYERFTLTDGYVHHSNIIIDTIDTSIQGVISFESYEDVGDSIMILGGPYKAKTTYGGRKGMFVRKVFLLVDKIQSVEFTIFKADQ